MQLLQEMHWNLDGTTTQQNLLLFNLLLLLLSQTNALTISPNGTDKINGTNDDYFATTKGVSLVLLYIDSTRGWKVIGGGEIDASGASFITATGGTNNLMR
jgi:hypothetical protein